MGLTHEDWVTLSRTFHKDVLLSVTSPFLQDYRPDGRRDAVFMLDLSWGKSDILASREGTITTSSRGREIAIPGLRKLLSDAKADVIFVPSSSELQFTTIPVALEYAGAIVIAKLSPSATHMLMSGQLDHLRWLHYHKGSGNVLVHHVFEEDHVRFATYMYLFPRQHRSEFLKLDVPYACSYICSDRRTGDITAML
jgi:hypothetical protein